MFCTIHGGSYTSFLVTCFFPVNGPGAVKTILIMYGASIRSAIIKTQSLQATISSQNGKTQTFFLSVAGFPLCTPLGESLSLWTTRVTGRVRTSMTGTVQQVIS